MKWSEWNSYPNFTGLKLLGSNIICFLTRQCNSANRNSDGTLYMSLTSEDLTKGLYIYLLSLKVRIVFVKTRNRNPIAEAGKINFFCVRNISRNGPM